MTEKEKKSLRFVVMNYRPGVFDTRKAIRKFKEIHRQVKYLRIRQAIIWTSAAAAVAVGIFACITLIRPEYVELASADEILTQTLPDSTIVMLSPRSSVKFDSRRFGSRHRKTEMTGKVYFCVARNENIPFEIYPPDGYVRVLGTEFQIDASAAGSVSVLVDKGKVLFSSNEDTGGIILTSGMGAVLDSGSEAPLSTDHPDMNENTWARGTFIFNDEPLDSVLEELSGYYGKKLHFTGKNRRITGIFNAGDLEETVRIIETALDVEITIE